ncbi:ArgR family transcriptional regulator [Colwellia sp. RSH04]|uniref:ArgR family transcriptional regulator n=1 Tax=Colwellia sp. RSH04 TaxID=2305464 RepID=UPI000E57EAEF|nr:ArgR family transcriptional regulator [Colwellia sp. RSH04]RHW76124.1 ArgR family transcriptional regulator [Colwellia sp. RSH04]
MTDYCEQRRLMNTFKVMLKEQKYRSQEELVYELVSRGFSNISQSKVSRMLTKVGAIRTRNAQNRIIYQLPDQLVIPKVDYAIYSIALTIKHNGYQIVLKTGSGGAPLIARVLDSLEESFGILGTISGDDSVLIIPSDVSKVDDITKRISTLFRLQVH